MLEQILRKKMLLFIIVIPTVSLGMVLSLPSLLFSNVDRHPYIIQNFQETIRVDLFAEGLSHPTSMVFMDNSTILVLEKDSGNIRKVSEGVLEEEPLLRVNVDSTAERGLLGIALLRKEKEDSTAINTNLDNDQNLSESSEKSAESFTLEAVSPPSLSTSCNCSVFIYVTQKNEARTTTATTGNHTNSNGRSSLRNVIYKYDWDSKSLINPTLLVDLPAEPGPYHNGGKLKIGPDHQLYAVIGDLTSPNSILQNHQHQITNNNQTHVLISNSSVVIRIDPYNGLPSEDNPFLKSHRNDSLVHVTDEGRGRGGALEYYYAYGIRNSFGLAFDPLTERLWDTENGEDEYDEINTVNPGFNSGWHKIMGPKSKHLNFSDSDLAMFKEARYSDPVFSWKETIGVTDIEFFNSSKLGDEYTNNLFVGDINNDNLYFFKVNDDRSGINFDDIPGIANDLVADNKEEADAVTLSTGFAGITDIETGPDDNLYILTYHDGRIYKITINNNL